MNKLLLMALVCVSKAFYLREDDPAFLSEEEGRKNALLLQKWDDIEKSVNEYLSHSKNAEHDNVNFYQVTPESRFNSRISSPQDLLGIEVNDPQVQLNALSSREIEANFPFDLPIKVIVNHGGAGAEYDDYDDDLNEKMAQFQLKWLDFQKDMISKLKGLITLEITEAGSDDYLISINRPNYTPERQFVAMVGRGMRWIKEDTSYILPFDVFNDVIFVPNIFEATIKLQHSCLIKAKTFKQVCKCALKTAEVSPTCDSFSNTKKLIKHDNSSFDELHQVGGLDFDDEFVYLPSYDKPYVVFDFSCFSSVKNMRDLCQCQVLQDENEKPECGAEEEATTAKPTQEPSSKETTEEIIETTTEGETTTVNSKMSSASSNRTLPKTTQINIAVDETTKPAATIRPSSKPTELPMTSSTTTAATTQMPSWENAKLKHIKVYIKDDNLRIQLYSEYLSPDEDFESPQFEPLDPLEDVHGKLIADVDSFLTDQGKKIDFYISKSKLKFNTTLPKFIILAKFYYKLPLNADPFSKIELEIGLDEVNTLSINPSRVTFGDYISDQLKSVDTNIGRVWDFYQSKDKPIDSNLYSEKCLMCKDCQTWPKNCDSTCHWSGKLTSCQKCQATDLSHLFAIDTWQPCKPCDPWNQYCKLMWTNSRHKVENQMRERVVASFNQEKTKEVADNVDHIKIDEDENESEEGTSSKKVDKEQSDEIATTEETTIKVNEPEEEVKVKESNNDNEIEKDKKNDNIKDEIKEKKTSKTSKVEEKSSSFKETIEKIKESKTQSESRKGSEKEENEIEVEEEDYDDEYYETLYGDEEEEEESSKPARIITKVGKIEEKELEDDDLIAETVIEEVDDEGDTSSEDEDLDKEPEERLQDPDYIPSSLKDVDKASKDQHANLAHDSSFAKGPSSSKKAPMALRTMGRNLLPKPRRPRANFKDFSK